MSLRSCFVALLLPLAGCSWLFTEEVASDPATQRSSLHSVAFDRLDGSRASFQEYEGRVLLVVNVASECGYTPQYAGLEKLHRELGARGLTVIGFPSNEFGGQEPGDASAIAQFCSSKFDVTFPLGAKLETKPGPTQSPLYAFLGGATGKLPGWNFCKYLVARDGTVLQFFAPDVAPDDPALRTAIDAALAAS
jgi:glutathione peroxidase